MTSAAEKKESEPIVGDAADYCPDVQEQRMRHLRATPELERDRARRLERKRAGHLLPYEADPEVEDPHWFSGVCTGWEAEIETPNDLTIEVAIGYDEDWHRPTRDEQLAELPLYNALRSMDLYRCRAAFGEDLGSYDRYVARLNELQETKMRAPRPDPKSP
jgi:hypothetical protein